MVGMWGERGRGEIEVAEKEREVNTVAKQNFNFNAEYRESLSLRNFAHTIIHTFCNIISRLLSKFSKRKNCLMYCTNLAYIQFFFLFEFISLQPSRVSLLQPAFYKSAIQTDSKSAEVYQAQRFRHYASEGYSCLVSSLARAMADEVEVEAATGRDELAPLALSDLDITAQELDFEGERERESWKGLRSSPFNP